MKSAELANYRKTLLALSRRLGGEYARIRDEALRGTGGATQGNLSSVPIHLADLGSDTFEQTLALNLLENEGQMLEQTAAALHRIEQGTFGHCQECGREIGLERLGVLPYTPYCLACARALEEGASAGAGAGSQQ